MVYSYLKTEPNYVDVCGAEESMYVIGYDDLRC